MASTSLSIARQDWDKGYAIIARLVNVALEQAGATDRVNVSGESLHASDFTKGWHKGPTVEDAAEMLLEYYFRIVNQLQTIVIHIERCPHWNILPDNPESSVGFLREMRPWAIYGEAIPQGRSGESPTSEGVATDICGTLGAIIGNPKCASEIVGMIEENAVRWRDWFNRQALKAPGKFTPDDGSPGKTAGNDSPYQPCVRVDGSEPPAELMQKLSKRPGSILAFLWKNPETTIDEINEKVYGKDSVQPASVKFVPTFVQPASVKAALDSLQVDLHAAGCGDYRVTEDNGVVIFKR